MARRISERSEAIFQAVLAGMNFKEAADHFGVRASWARVVFYREARRRAAIPAGAEVEEMRRILLEDLGAEKETPG